MKHVSLTWAAPVLLAPVLAVLLLMLILLGCGGGGSGSAPTPVPTMGALEVGIVASSPTNFESLLVNLVSVRLNPSTDPNVSDSDPNWVTINVPPGIGAGGALQVNLNLIQNEVALFNISRVPSQVYNQIELQMDSGLPGNVVPACGIAPIEGCISYPLVFSAGFSSSILHATASGGVNVSSNVTTPLILNFSPGGILPPVPSPTATATSGASPPLIVGPYVMGNPTISIASASSPSPLLGTISGTAAVGQTVTAELTGTNTIIASTQTFGATSPAPYSLLLPASSSGTTYDIYAGGFNPTTTGAVNTTTAAISGVTVTPGNTVANQNFSIASGATNIMAGNISSAATNQPIQGATITLLIAPQNNSSANCASAPTSCVVVATANTDEVGNYPLPGNAFVKAPFAFVSVQPYTMEVVAPGYNPFFTIATPGAGAGGNPICNGSTSQTSCSLTLSNTTISGTVTIDTPPPAGSNVQVLIAAEDSGTHNLENTALTTIPSGAASASFTINVPTTPPSFDLIASAQDLFLGVPSRFPGHQFAVLRGVPGSATGVNLATLNCVGQASVTGTALNPGTGTTVGVSKSNVQLMQVPVIPAGVTGAGGFILCVPPDNYAVQRYENGTPSGSSVPVTAATPQPTSSPCPSICGSTASCPGICSNTPLGGNL